MPSENCKQAVMAVLVVLVTLRLARHVVSCQLSVGGIPADMHEISHHHGRSGRFFGFPPAACAACPHEPADG